MHERLPEQFSLQPQRLLTLPRMLAVFALGALVWALAARETGPCDLWDQSQHKTVSYTTDMIVNGGTHWILPIEAGQYPATKPPLYNWIAAPFVRLMGFSSELAHKMPSVLALVACWAMVIWLGQRIDDRQTALMGWLAGLMLPANYTMFKLGYLARPDMLLTLWLTLAWMLATASLIGARSRVKCADVHEDSAGLRHDRWRAIGFWACIALAFLTKGPAVLVGIVFVFLAAKLIGGSWTSMHMLRPIIGLTISSAFAAAWVYGAWRINPHHAREVLVFAEFWGRVTGTGPEGFDGDWRDWVIALPNQLFYFSVRFAPWSLCTGVAMIMLWWAHRHTKAQKSLASQPVDRVLWLWSCALHIAVVIGLYTLSAGKRADYVASAFPPAAILASWCMVQAHRRLGLAWVCVTPAASAVTLAGLTVVNRMQTEAPSPAFSDDVSTFIAQASAAVNSEPAPVYFSATGENHLQAMFGVSSATDPLDIVLANKRREIVWVIVGRRANTSQEFEEWFRAQRPRAVIEMVLQTPKLAAQDGWPEQLSLYKIAPRQRPNPPEP